MKKSFSDIAQYYTWDGNEWTPQNLACSAHPKRSKAPKQDECRQCNMCWAVGSRLFFFFLICEFLSRFKDHTVHSWGASKLQVHRIREKKSGFFKAQGSEISQGKQPEYHTFLPWNSHMKNSLLYLPLQNLCWRFGHCFLRRMASKRRHFGQRQMA